ncbi:MAG TPA: class I SAM-dependent methyltransferase [Saprospiraceae bacterium]|nr:class I SAM-dependent methyltransferase [Saprospiraceae bacterium]HMQ84093.1 class I SAM-dependent methyltransferase [Saprospiraceae bacterium]
MKDLFSQDSAAYAKYRPVYPDALFSHLAAHLLECQNAWDCGTGNGQVAQALVPFFDQIFATDISEKQIEQAFQHPKINYSLESAEKSSFPDQFFDLIVVAQAIHWFDFDRFYLEVRRTLKPEGLLLVLGYGLFRATPTIDQLIDHFYQDTIGKYWDPERKYIDENYQTIPFPFREISIPPFQMDTIWNLADLMGYLNTWSAVKHFIQDKGFNPTLALAEELELIWPDKTQVAINFPLLIRVGRV